MSSETVIYAFTSLPGLCENFLNETCNEMCDKVHIRYNIVCMNYYIHGKCVEDHKDIKNLVHIEYKDFEPDIMHGLDRMIDRSTSPNFKIKPHIRKPYYPPVELERSNSTKESKLRILDLKSPRSGREEKSPVPHRTVSPLSISNKFDILNESPIDTILDKFNLENLKPIFEAENIDIHALKGIKHEDFDEIYKKYQIRISIGTRIKLVQEASKY